MKEPILYARMFFSFLLICTIVLCLIISRRMKVHETQLDRVGLVVFCVEVLILTVLIWFI